MEAIRKKAENKSLIQKKEEETGQQICMMKNFKAFAVQDDINFLFLFCYEIISKNIHCSLMLLELVIFSNECEKVLISALNVTKGITQDHTQENLHLGYKYT